MRGNSQFKICNSRSIKSSRLGNLRWGKSFVGIRGFTLIELLVVMGVIAVLAAMSIFGLQGARESGRDARRKGDLESIRSGLELYKADCGQYPASITAGSSLVGTNTTGSCLTTNIYIQSVPDDPITGRDYSYVPNLSHTTYITCAALEGNTAFDTACGIVGANCGSTCSYHVRNP